MIVIIFFRFYVDCSVDDGGCATIEWSRPFCIHQEGCWNLHQGRMWVIFPFFNDLWLIFVFGLIENHLFYFWVSTRSSTTLLHQTRNWHRQLRRQRWWRVIENGKKKEIKAQIDWYRGLHKRFVVIHLPGLVVIVNKDLPKVAYRNQTLWSRWDWNKYTTYPHPHSFAPAQSTSSKPIESALCTNGTMPPTANKKTDFVNALLWFVLANLSSTFGLSWLIWCFSSLLDCIREGQITTFFSISLFLNRRHRRVPKAIN